MTKLKVLKNKPRNVYNVYKNSRFSGKFKACSPLQLSCKLTELKPTNSYERITQRLVIGKYTQLYKDTFELCNNKPNFE